MTREEERVRGLRAAIPNRTDSGRWLVGWLVGRRGGEGGGRGGGRGGEEWVGGNVLVTFLRPNVLATGSSCR